MIRYFGSFFLALAIILGTHALYVGHQEAAYAAQEENARVAAKQNAPKPLPALTDSLATLGQPSVAKTSATAAPAPSRGADQFVTDPSRLNPGAVVPVRSQPVKELAATPPARRAATTVVPETAPTRPAAIARSAAPQVAPAIDPAVAAAIAQWAPIDLVPAAAPKGEVRAPIAAALAQYAPTVPMVIPTVVARTSPDFTATVGATFVQGFVDLEAEMVALVASMPAFAQPEPQRSEEVAAAAETPSQVDVELPAVVIAATPAAMSEPSIFADLRFSLRADPADVGFSPLTTLVAFGGIGAAEELQEPATELVADLPVVREPVAVVAVTSAPKRRLSAEEVAMMVARLERSEEDRMAKPAVVTAVPVRRPKGLGLLPIMNPSPRALQPGEDPLPEEDAPAPRAETRAKPLAQSAYVMPLGLRWGWQSKRVMRFNAFSFPDAEVEQEVREAGDGSISVSGITELGPWNKAKYEFGTAGLRKAVFVFQPAGPGAAEQAEESLKSVREDIRGTLGAGEVLLRYQRQPSKSDPSVLETLNITRWTDGDTIVQLDHFAAEQGTQRFDVVTLTCTRR